MKKIDLSRKDKFWVVWADRMEVNSIYTGFEGYRILFPESANSLYGLFHI
ncbi:MAG: hypothetical protein ACE5K2_01355 [Candidatus Zixiibacteriota bacterium]